jgi:TetR/AcrR family transcriptional repressor of nem operon
MSKIKTQYKIVETAARLFWEKSYQSVSVDVICREADIKKGSFYHFYSSKETVALAVLEHLWEETKRYNLEPVLENETLSPIEKIEHIIVACETQSAEMHAPHGCFQGCPFGNLVLELGTQKEQVRDHVAEIFNRYFEVFHTLFAAAAAQGELRQSVDPKEATRIFLSCLEGACVMAKTYNDPAMIGRNLRCFLAMVKK